MGSADGASVAATAASVATTASVAGATVGAGVPQAASARDRINPMSKVNLIVRDMFQFSYKKMIRFPLATANGIKPT
jgi:hypothetical protein